jgi:hypothetical protein
MPIKETLVAVDSITQPQETRVESGRIDIASAITASA